MSITNVLLMENPSVV